MGSIAWLLLVAKEVVDIDRGVVGDLILVFIGVINISLICPFHLCWRQFTNNLSKYVIVNVTISNYVEQCC